MALEIFNDALAHVRFIARLRDGTHRRSGVLNGILPPGEGLLSEDSAMTTRAAWDLLVITTITITTSRRFICFLGSLPEQRRRTPSRTEVQLLARW
jgi:hypothetical protein